MTSSFAGEELKQIVDLGGQALESEDKYIRKCFKNNPVYGGQVPGITFLRDERYYQRIVVRALFPSFRYMVKPEYKKFDMALFQSSPEPVALGELKLWLDAAFGAIRGIRRDMKKLSAVNCAQFILVFTAGAKEWLPEGVDEMLGRLECSKKEH